MRSLYIWLSRLIALAVVLQVLFVAWSAFDIYNNAGDGVAFTEDTERNIGADAALGGRHDGHSGAGAALRASSRSSPRCAAAWRWPGSSSAWSSSRSRWPSRRSRAPVVGTLHALNAFAVAGIAGMAGSRVPPGPIPSVAAPAGSSDPGSPRAHDGPGRPGRAGDNLGRAGQPCPRTAGSDGRASVAPDAVRRCGGRRAWRTWVRHSCAGARSGCRWCWSARSAISGSTAGSRRPIR